MESFIFILKAIIEGIVEGITEFLPVSSTGHMIIIASLIGFTAGVSPTDLYTKEYIDTFEVVIQLGAILAIVVLYWNKIKNSFKNFWPNKPNSGFKFWFNIGIASIPSGVLGILFHKTIKDKLFNSITVTAALFVGAIWMLYAEKKYRKNNRTKSMEAVTIKQAFIIGCFQCLALWPGMSRSASTIIGAWIAGLSTVAAAEFSFFLAIPAMVGASFVSLKDMNFAVLTSTHVIALTVGFVVSFIVAVIVVDRFIAFLKKKPMKVFAIYRIILSIVLLILIVFGVVH